MGPRLFSRGNRAALVRKPLRAIHFNGADLLAGCGVDSDMIPWDDWFGNYRVAEF
jgi:hypothetical protein